MQKFLIYCFLMCEKIAIKMLLNELARKWEERRKKINRFTLIASRVKFDLMVILLQEISSSLLSSFKFNFLFLFFSLCLSHLIVFKTNEARYKAKRKKLKAKKLNKHFLAKQRGRERERGGPHVFKFFIHFNNFCFRLLKTSFSHGVFFFTWWSVYY